MYRNAWNAWRKAKEAKRVPPWIRFARDVLPVYRALLRGKKLYDPVTAKNGWVVDHIISLRGKIVSGLHVPTNLQALRFCENSSKGSEYVAGVAELSLL